MPSKPVKGPPARSVELYDRLVAMRPGVERRGVTLPYTSVNGHMFSYLDAAGTLALRLAPAERSAFMARYDAGPMIAHGREQRDYVAVPGSLLERLEELEPWFDASFRHAAGLKPKPSGR